MTSFDNFTFVFDGPNANSGGDLSDVRRRPVTRSARGAPATAVRNSPPPTVVMPENSEPTHMTRQQMQDKAARFRQQRADAAWNRMAWQLGAGITLGFAGMVGVALYEWWNDSPDRAQARTDAMFGVPRSEVLLGEIDKPVSDLLNENPTQGEGAGTPAVPGAGWRYPHISIFLDQQLRRKHT